MLTNSRIMYHTLVISSLLELRHERRGAILKICITNFLNYLPPFLIGSAVIASDTVEIALQRYAEQMASGTSTMNSLLTLTTTLSSSLSTTTTTTLVPSSTMGQAETPDEIIFGQLLLMIFAMVLVDFIWQGPVKIIAEPIYNKIFGSPNADPAPAIEDLSDTMVSGQLDVVPVLSVGYKNWNNFRFTLVDMLRPESPLRSGVKWKEVAVAALIKSFELCYFATVAVVANYYDPTSTLNKKNPDQSIDIQGAKFYGADYGLIILTMFLAIIPYQIMKMIASKVQQATNCFSGKGNTMGSEARSGNSDSMKFWPTNAQMVKSAAQKRGSETDPLLDRDRGGVSTNSVLDVRSVSSTGDSLDDNAPTSSDNKDTSSYNIV